MGACLGRKGRGVFDPSESCLSLGVHHYDLGVDNDLAISRITFSNFSADRYSMDIRFSQPIKDFAAPVRERRPLFPNKKQLSNRVNA